MHSYIWGRDFIDSLRRSGCGRGGKYLMVISSPVPDLLSKPTCHLLPEKSAQEFKKRCCRVWGRLSSLLRQGLFITLRPVSAQSLVVGRFKIGLKFLTYSTSCKNIHISERSLKNLLLSNERPVHSSELPRDSLEKILFLSTGPPPYKGFSSCLTSDG